MKGMDFIGEYNGRMERALGSKWFDPNAKGVKEYLKKYSDEEREAL